jgi:hypothetical protein
MIHASYQIQGGKEAMREESRLLQQNQTWGREERMKGREAQHRLAMTIDRSKKSKSEGSFSCDDHSTTQERKKEMFFCSSWFFIASCCFACSLTPSA